MKKLKYVILFIPYLIAAFFILAKEATAKKIDGYRYARKVRKDEKERRDNVQYITPVRKPF